MISDIFANYHEASKCVNELMRNEVPALVIGTSHGRFKTLTIYTPFRIAINSPLYPFKIVPLIVTPNEIISI
ncbi:MAG: hypothetical protein J1E16_05980 [Muribaculaceae bacterium]|nr:hypothetical protein [Muribaculaceae bacterium]